MARMHTRKRGKSKSRKPMNSSAHLWVQQSKEEIEELVEKFAKEGKTEAETGTILRDLHAVPSVKKITGKTISQILKEKKLLPEYPTDLIDLIRKAIAMRKHMAKNKKDKLNRQKLTCVESKIRRLVTYYRGKRLPAQWKYDPEKAALLVK